MAARSSSTQRSTHTYPNLRADLTLRALVLGLLGAALITTTSTYVTLKLGALPWPIIFVAILSYAILKLLGSTNLSEVNVAHTAMSAGGMVAAGMTYTVPGIWMLDPAASMPWAHLLAALICGSIIGLGMSALIRKHFIVNQDLAYPVGVAAAETVMAGDAGGLRAKLLFGSMTIGGMVAWLREGVHLIPARVNLIAYNPASVFGIQLAPMMLSMGMLIGTTSSFMWFAGALVGHLGVTGLGAQVTSIAHNDLSTVRSTLGIGVMMGTGAGIIIKLFVVPLLRRAIKVFSGGGQLSTSSLDTSLALAHVRRDGSVHTKRHKGEGLDEDAQGNPLVNGALILPHQTLHEQAFHRISCGMTARVVLSIFVVVFITIFTVVLKLSLAASIICIIGASVAVLMSAQSSGDVGINPLEIFAVIIMLAARLVTDVSGTPAFLMTAIVAVACGLAGDVMHDFKAGRMMGTNPCAQWVSEACGAIVASVVAVGVLYVLTQAYGTTAFGFDKPFVAPQASAIATLVQGIEYPVVFGIGMVCSAALHVAGFPVMTVGLGIYLPFHTSCAIALGGFLKWLYTKLWPQVVSSRLDMVVASGIIGGESLVGVAVALIHVFL